MTWEELQTILVVARERSYLRAARRLGVSHTTVGRRVAAIEARLRVPLFTRARGELEATAHARTLLERAADVEVAIAAANRTAASLAADEERGVVRLATSSILVEALVAPHVHELAARAPGVVLGLVVGRRLVELTRGEADIALRLRPPGAFVAEPAIVVVRLGRVAWGVYGSAKRGAPSDPATGPWVRFAEGQEPGREWLERHAARAPTCATVDYAPAALALARAGAGLAVLPHALARRAGDLVRVGPTVEEHVLYAATPADKKRIPRVAKVLAFLKHAAAREARALRGD
ncbi:MAG TPA: LysR family transcriptional regulator [Polyangiaceae bacterium]|nr:LysR family transcriptional regulator [Polyangiaceae bacterium]